MESTRNNTSVEISSIPTTNSLCAARVAVFCIIMSTVTFFVSVATIVWLFEHKVSYKYSVVCFLVGSGILYIVAFMSSFVLLTGELSKRPKSISRSREEPNVDLTGCVQSGEGSETASDISYRRGDTHLPLPPSVTVIKTPPPPYKGPSGISTSQSDMGQVQLNQNSNNPGSSQDRFYYELNRDEVQERELARRQRPLQHENFSAGFDIEMQPMFLNNSYPVTNALKQQMASHSPILLQKQGEALRENAQESMGNSKPELTSSESSRSALKVKRNPSQVVKRKLKAKLSMSHPDLLSEVSQNSRSSLNPESRASRSDCNGETRSLQYNLTPQGTPRILRSNPEARTSLLNLDPQGTPRISISNAEVRTSVTNFNPQGTPRISISDAEVRTSGSSLSIGKNERPSQLDCNEGPVSLQSNLNCQGTSVISRFSAEERTFQSSLSPEGRLQNSRLGWNEETKTSLPNLKPEGTPRFSRSNIARTSQMNLIPQPRLQTSPSSFSVEQKRSPSNLNPASCKLESLSNLISERKPLDYMSSYLVPTDRRFTSHSNLHLNSQQSYSTTSSYGLQRTPQVDTDSNASLKTSCSNIVGVDLKQYSQPVEQLQKLSQPQQFLASSINVPMLQKAQSFTSLPGTNSLKHVSMETVPKMGREEHLPNPSSNRQMSGRSTESVLDATRNCKQMTPKEWIVAWNQGFHKLPTKEAERVVGVRL